LFTFGKIKKHLDGIYQNITFTTPGTGGNKACGDTKIGLESTIDQVSAKQEAACPLGQR
jgi:hypothetical protein